MKEEAFHSIVRADGSLDPSCFERMGEEWIESWLRNHLSGSDPYFPIDTRTGEDPESFVVGLLRQAGATHPAAASIARVVLRLLDEARRLAPQVPSWLSPLLRLCQQVHLDLTFSWFHEELQATARDPEAAQQRWADLQTLREILVAAVAQAPGRPHSSPRGSWLVLLRKPDFCSLALAGLGASFEQKLPFLADWWRSCPPERRRRELSYLIYRAVDQEEPLTSFLGKALSFPSNLREAIDQELHAQGAQPFFAAQRRSQGGAGALVNSGLRREFLLGQNQRSAQAP